MKNTSFVLTKNKFNLFRYTAILFLLFNTLSSLNAADNSSNNIATNPIIIVSSLGTLSLSKDTAYLSGDTIVVTVVDIDRNTSLTTTDTLTTALKITGTNYSVGTDLTMNLVENGVNTGTFLASITTGISTTGGGTGANSGTIKAIQSGIANVVYTDISPTASSATKNLSFSASDATLAFDADSYTLGTYALVTLVDAERNTSITVAQSLLSDVFIQTSSANNTKVRMIETGVDTGTFKGSIQVASSGDTTEFSKIKAAEGDTLTISYTDEVNTTGSSRTMTDTASVTAEGTTISTPTPSPTLTLTPTPTPTSIPIPDTVIPTGSININNDAEYTNSTTITLSLSATDDVGVTGNYISTVSTIPSIFDSGWLSITSTTSYTENVSYTLSSGDGNKTVYVWYKDDSGNISSSFNDSIILDTTPPTIIITSPTSSSIYTSTSEIISIEGVAFDYTSGISSVTWNNDKGGSGTASGTTSWLSSSISLLSGENIITVTAADGAGNKGTDTITVKFDSSTAPTPISQLSPTPTPTLNPSSSPIPTLTPTQEPSSKGIISGYVINARKYPIESAKIRLKGVNSKVLKKTTSDEDGLFEFTDLNADTYTIIALKKGYKTVKQTITLEAGEEKDIEIVMKRTTKKGIYSEN